MSCLGAASFLAAVQADPRPARFGAVWTGVNLVTGSRCLNGRLFSSPALFLGSSFSSLFEVLNADSFDKGPPATSLSKYNLFIKTSNF